MPPCRVDAELSDDDDCRDAMMLSLKTIVHKLGHGGRRVDIFKIDCEGCEYDTYEGWFEAGIDIRQIQAELHPESPNMHFANQATLPHRKRQLPKAQLFFIELTKRGYEIFHKEPNTLGCQGNCIEFAFLKLNPAFRGDDNLKLDAGNQELQKHFASPPSSKLYNGFNYGSQSQLDQKHMKSIIDQEGITKLFDSVPFVQLPNGKMNVAPSTEMDDEFDDIEVDDEFEHLDKEDVSSEARYQNPNQYLDSDFSAVKQKSQQKWNAKAANLAGKKQISQAFTKFQNNFQKGWSTRADGRSYAKEVPGRSHSTRKEAGQKQTETFNFS
jgi:hypothetical protein